MRRFCGLQDSEPHAPDCGIRAKNPHDGSSGALDPGLDAMEFDRAVAACVLARGKREWVDEAAAPAVLTQGRRDRAAHTMNGVYGNITMIPTGQFSREKTDELKEELTAILQAVATVDQRLLVLTHGISARDLKEAEGNSGAGRTRAVEAQAQILGRGATDSNGTHDQSWLDFDRVRVPQSRMDIPELFAVRDEITSEIRAAKSILVEEFASMKKEIMSNSLRKKTADFRQGSFDSSQPRSTPPRLSRNLSATTELVALPRRSINCDEAIAEDWGTQRIAAPKGQQRAHELRQNLRLSGKFQPTKTDTSLDHTRKKKRGLFSFPVGKLHTTEDVKRRVLENNMAITNCVNDKYYKTGFFQKVAKSEHFENVTVIVIVANALWMAIETDLNRATCLTKAKPEFIIADILFFTFFCVELAIRFIAFRYKVNCFFDAWFMFDLSLVLLYCVDPFILGLIQILAGSEDVDLPTSVLRLIRLARLSRLTRLLRSFPELLIMIKGMLTAMATVGYTLGLLGSVTFVFAIAIRNVMPKGSVQQLYFLTVPETMHVLILHGLLMDNIAEFIVAIKDTYTPVFVLVWVYVTLSSLLVMNMLIGIICEVVSAVATEERELIMVEQVKEKFTALLQEYDANNTGALEWEEFEMLLLDKNAQKALKMVDVKMENLIDMAEDFFFYSHHHEPEETVFISYKEFIRLLLDLRGSQRATVKDVMAIGKRVNAKFAELTVMLQALECKLDPDDD